MTENSTPYPVRVDASLDAGLSRGLWLVKWLLLIPHFVVLVFLWIAFTVVSVVAFFAILITARYPRPLFDFNAGVLRWSWRVHYYGYGALGTDRYPPFTLAEVPDYPAHLDVPYPERLSRGLVLVKWWLLALPHYVVVGLFVGGGIWIGTRGTDDPGTWDDGWAAGGLVALLVFIAGVVLLFTGRYPRPIYDFVLGMDRWVLRVAAYAALMTDRYPPFRLDMGGSDPGSIPVAPTPPPPTGQPSAAHAAAAPAGPSAAAPRAVADSNWTAGRIVSVILGALLLFLSTGLVVGGGALLWADRTQRDGDHLWSSWTEISSSRYALTSDRIRLDTDGAGWVFDDVLGTARLEVTADDPGDELFVGVGDTADVDTYLSGVGHHRMGDLGPRWSGGGLGPGTTSVPGGAPGMPPADADIWVAEASGPGTRVLDWRPAEGEWTVVVMRADGTAGIAAEARIGVTAPRLSWLAGALIVTGALLAVAGVLVVALAVHRAQPRPTRGADDTWVPPAPRAPVQTGRADPTVPPDGVSGEVRSGSEPRRPT